MTRGEPGIELRGVLARYWPLSLIAGRCAAAMAAGTMWILGATAAVVVLCLIHILRISAVELLVVTMPVSFYAGAGPLVVNVTVSDFLLAVVAVQLFADRDIRRVVSKFSGPLSTALAVSGLFVITCGGTIWVRSLLGLDTDWVEFVSNAFKLVIVMVFFFVCVVAFGRLDREGLRRVLSLWAMTAAVVGALGAVASILYPLGIDIGMSFDFRATATFEDPNAFASYLLLSIPICLLARHLSGRHLFGWQLLPILAGVYTSYSRGAIIALTVMLVGLFVFSLGDRALRLLRILSAVVAVAAVCLLLSGAVDALFEDSRGTGFETDIRFQLWQAAWELWKTSPIFGVGLGQFVGSAAGFIDHGAEGVIAHSTYLSMLSETGLVGFVLFMLVPVHVGVALVRDRSTGSRLFGGSLLSVLVMAASLNLQNSRSLWVLLALALAWTARGLSEQGREYRENARFRPTRSSRMPGKQKHTMSGVRR
ncbi:O-antigen ligase [Brevibacterium sp.]|uniref:O-antigen ligase family protein n=1 Tax=Brevibacterium sp. TaxID=1701 RepID=UPI002649B76D|nr:O-antigen ligase family protein [Brevibacterium sp.]MDN6604656.1 O-antigen ligase family protein [Brevibacterium sp.]